MYVETDFILALLKDEDWLKDRAEEVYRNEDDLWTSRYTFVELMLISYREGWNSTRIVSNAAKLVETPDIEDIKAACTYIEREDFTPFDALHLVKSGDAKIVSSDKSYEGFSQRLSLEKDQN